jgi:hypothetical protein
MSVIVSLVYLSNCRERSPSGEANGRTADKYISRLGWISKVHDRVHKSLRTVPKKLVLSSRPCVAFHNIMWYIEAPGSGTVLMTVYTYQSLTIYLQSYVISSVQLYAGCLSRPYVCYL